jgi:hypothetical protein
VAGAAVVMVLAAWAAIRAPAAAIAGSGAVTLALPAELIRSAAVREQLTSGLTTVFIVTASASDGSHDASGAVRVSIRLELWEERYLVQVTDATGQQRSLTFASDGDLAKWWSGGSFVVLTPHPFPKSVEVDVRLRMLPFSAQEEADTRRWLSRSISSAPQGSSDNSERSATILRALVETSIRRRPLLDLRWRVRATRESTP